MRCPGCRERIRGSVAEQPDDPGAFRARKRAKSCRRVGMPRVVVEMSLSLDGYIAGPGDVPGHAFGGRSAHRLHDWLFSGPEPYERNAFFRPQGRNREFVDGLFEKTGAMLTGRRTYDLVNAWGGSHPIPGLPVVVLTHAPHSIVPQGRSAFTFCRGVREA